MQKLYDFANQQEASAIEKALEVSTVWKTLAENAGLEARGGTFREVAEAGLSGVRITLPADCGESKAMMGWFIV